jgi:hypothetical protein
MMSAATSVRVKLATSRKTPRSSARRSTAGRWDHQDERHPAIDLHRRQQRTSAWK